VTKNEQKESPKKFCSHFPVLRTEQKQQQKIEFFLSQKKEKISCDFFLLVLHHQKNQYLNR